MKNKLIKVGVISIGALSLFGCGNDVPTCSAKETQDLVKQIANEEMGNQIGVEAASNFTYSLKGIRTTDENDKTGAFKCAADLYIHAANGGENDIPITYTVEGTDDGKEFYVNVFGL
ncbi:hypothetical protein [Vibrio aestuarianus]|uniref:Lipoprotein n=1 Tax=Vibrio aestuarianus TaxID=28171 RepID=A0ABD7YQJ2_9VIBR|nr:hypothetical protein [Vibrio aestuarianus]WGK87231.1 hypothetical protein PYE67_13995 [Vibrio aestuarianus]CAH8235478.1 conserved exported hypothetical protein [Vibrio aestuarianus]